MHNNTPTHIVLVDDDPMMAQLLQAAIEDCFGQQVRVEAFTDPAEAQARLESQVVDLLVTDLEMPGISGLQLLRSAKQRNAWTQTVVITGHSDRDALADALEEGAADYLVKPLDIGEVEEVIRETHRRIQRWRQALARTFAHCCQESR